MGLPILKTEIAKEDTQSKSTSGSTREKVETTYTSELVIGICSPIGSSKAIVIEAIKNTLSIKYDYQVEVIKISDYIQVYASKSDDEAPGQTIPFTSLMNKIKGGNELRNKYNSAFLAELAIKDIYLDRMKGKDNEFKKPEDLTSRRKCYIIDSLKNKEELFLLRSLYRDVFYQFSIFSPKNERFENLLDQDLSKIECNTLIDTDEYENNNDGQNVRNTFVEGDFFVRVSDKNKDTIPGKIERYLHLIFESKIVTPHPNEIAMYEAKSAAGNSACLSRQVGAAITNEKGEIISRGWNDVPKYGGNLYKDGDAIDNRCITNGHCSNDSTKDKLTANIIEIITNDELFKKYILSESDPTFINRLNESVRKSTKVKDLIEFSRSVHAEMHAMIIGSQLAGSKMVGGKLFCTTYPCHNCGRHLIVAGIKEIYYIEPYVKSLCTELHSDAITEAEDEENKVRILMYDGAAPRRYLDFFTMKADRKDKMGQIREVDLTKVTPKTRISLQALPILEVQALHYLRERGIIKLEE